MTKQDKIKRWLDDNGFTNRRSALICRYAHGDVSRYEGTPTSEVIRCLDRYSETPIGLITPDDTWIPAPKFEDDVKAPVALPRQERGKRFEPEKFVPDNGRNVLLRFNVGEMFVGYFTNDLVDTIFVLSPSGAHLKLAQTFYANRSFTWEEL